MYLFRLKFSPPTTKIFFSLQSTHNQFTPFSARTHSSNMNGMDHHYIIIVFILSSFGIKQPFGTSHHNQKNQGRKNDNKQIYSFLWALRSWIPSLMMVVLFCHGCITKIIKFYCYPALFYGAVQRNQKYSLALFRGDDLISSAFDN